MTVLLGPVPCRACGTLVTVVRRPVMIHDSHGSNQYQARPSSVPSGELREVVVLSGENIEHLCYNRVAEYSGAPDIMHTAPRPASRLYSETAGRLRSGVQTE